MGSGLLGLENAVFYIRRPAFHATQASVKKESCGKRSVNASSEESYTPTNQPMITIMIFTFIPSVGCPCKGSGYVPFRTAISLGLLAWHPSTMINAQAVGSGQTSGASTACLVAL